MEGPANPWQEQTWAILVLQCAYFGIISYFVGCNGLNRKPQVKGLLQNTVFHSNSYYC